MRVVSLVPSVTETLLAWGLEPVACTRFCEQPRLPHVGGTKNPDLDAIIELAPDLVVMCDEENRRVDADALSDVGLKVHSCSPRSVQEVEPELASLAAAVEVQPAGALMGGPVPALEPLGVRVFVPIWRRPWMTIGDDTYGASLLRSLGVDNVGDPAGSADRYPEVQLGAVAHQEVDLVLAPSEPYAFKAPHLEELREAVGPTVEVDGQDLFWWGSRTPDAVRRLHGQLSLACSTLS